MLNLYDRMVMDASAAETQKETKYFKHLGELKSDKTKVIILFRLVPREPEKCLVVGPKFLSDIQHADIMRALESKDGQSSFELGTHLGKIKFSDGTEMLSSLHIENYIKKIYTNEVIVTYGPGKDGKIALDQLNKMIAEDMKMSLHELSLIDAPKTAKKKK